MTYALAGYLSLTLLVYFSQRKMLYLPDKSAVSGDVTVIRGMHPWPPDTEYRGYIGLAGQTSERGTVVVLHGNAGNASDRTYYLEALEPLGYRVILIEYPGYGDRGGKPTESQLVQDAVDTLKRVKKIYGAPIYLWGESLGAGVAAATVANAETPIDGVVMMTPWDTLGEVAQSHYWYLPARWLVKDKYNSVDNLSDYSGNVAVVLAGRDEVIPVRHGEKLWQSIKSNKKLWVFEHATHNRMPLEPSRSWWREVMHFLSSEHVSE
ncbi:MAG: alpha/beta hydrolase [Pseudomonadota bacterium]